MLPLSSSQQAANNPHGSSNSSSGHADDGDRNCDPQRPPATPPPDGSGPKSVIFRVLRGGRYNTLSDSSGGGDRTPEADLVEVSLDQGGGGGLDNSAENLREFLFLVRSSQPGSIGEELQRRGIRVFPEEAFVDVDVDVDGEAAGAGAEAESGGASSAPTTTAAGGATPAASAEAREHDDDGLSQFSWEGGTPLPLDTPMAGLPRDGEGRARLVLWDPCGKERIRYAGRFLAWPYYHAKPHVISKRQTEKRPVYCTPYTYILVYSTAVAGQQSFPSPVYGPALHRIL